MQNEMCQEKNIAMYYTGSWSTMRDTQDEWNGVWGTPEWYHLIYWYGELGLQAVKQVIVLKKYFKTIEVLEIDLKKNSDFAAMGVRIKTMCCPMARCLLKNNFISPYHHITYTDTDSKIVGGSQCVGTIKKMKGWAEKKP